MDCSTPGLPVHQTPELNWCPLSQWYHPTILSSVTHFSSSLQSFPGSGSFPMSQFFPPGAQSIGVSASVSVLPMSIQDWFPLGLTGLITLQSRGPSRFIFNTTAWKHQFFQQFSLLSTLTSVYDYTCGKTIALTIHIFVGKAMSLLFNMLSKLVKTFLPRSKHLLISWLQSPSAVILEPPKIKSDTVSTVSPSISHEMMDQMPWSSFSECRALSQLFHSPLVNIGSLIVKSTAYLC